MRKAGLALFAVVCGICFPHYAACMDWVDSAGYGDALYIVQDTHFAPDVSVNAGAVYVLSSLLLENEASIRGDIYVCGGCDFVLRNSGVITGQIHLGGGGGMIQLVKDKQDVSVLNVDGPYVVMVDGVNDISWNDLMTIGNNAGTLVVSDSSFTWSGDMSAATYVPGHEQRTVLNGLITIKLPDGISVADANPLLRNVQGDAAIVVSGMSDKMFTYVSYVQDGDLYVAVARETDYMKVLDGYLGHLLNTVRDMWPDDTLLRRLDAAQTMSELYGIMSHSIAFNPGILGRPIRTLNRFVVNSVDLNVVDETGVSGRPFYVRSENFDMYGGIANFSVGGANGFYSGVSLYAAVAESDDEINRFIADMFGGRFAAGYRKGILNLRAMAGGTYGDFDVPYIFDNLHIRDNARGMSGYGVMDAGLDFGVLAPYVGAEYYFESVLDSRNDERALRAGIDSKFVFDSEIGKYQYKMTVGVNSAGVLHGGVGIGFLSPDDMVGGDVAINVMRDEYATSFMLSASAKILF